jgi:hypothetical protein
LERKLTLCAVRLKVYVALPEGDAGNVPGETEAESAGDSERPGCSEDAVGNPISEHSPHEEP